MLKKPLLLLLFLLFCAKGFSATFVVTSNADSGPGTLRDALTQAAANGTTEKDYINFNFSDTSQIGRTITLISQLPDVTSNLVIDGSTQTGGVFGASTARIEIASPQNYNPITVFNGSNVNDVEIYGIYFYDYYNADISYPGLQPHIGVKVINSTNFIFGAAGKGNLMRGFNYYGLDIENTVGVILKANLIGFGKSTSTEKDGDGYGFSSMINLYECNNIQIGGNSNEGNVIFTALIIQFYQNTQNTISIKSNNFMVYPNGTTTEWALDLFPYFSVSISTVYPYNISGYTQETQNCASVNMDIENNLTGGTFGIFQFSFLNGTINFTNNFFNVARDGITNITYYSQITAPQSPVNIAYCRAQFNFGTNNLSQKNLFYNCGPCVSVQNDPNVFMRNNDFKCVYNGYSDDTTHSNAYINTGDGPYTLYQLPTVNISKIGTNGASTIVNGTATPNSIIDIYSSESCTSQCSIRSYMQTANADNNGNWQANLNNYSGIFWVSATLNNQTSKYSSIQVNSDSIHIQPLRCTDTATITGLTVPQGVSYYWADVNGNFISNNINLIVTQPGQYQLVLNGGCIRSPFYQIDDDRILMPAGDATITNPSCSLANGSIGLFVFDPLYKITSETWTDGNEKIVGDTDRITNIPFGNYTFTVKTSDGCVKTFGPITLKNTTGPNIDQSHIKIQSTNCGQSIGSITSIPATGTGTLQYQWSNSQQQIVSTDSILVNQPAGTYTLQVTDGTACGPVSSSAISIPETNGITMDESQAVTTPSSCGNNNGSVTGIITTGATQYKWLDANNNTVATTLNLQNASSGNYTLVASNSFGCIQTSKTYFIAQPPATIYPAYAVSMSASCYGLNNGSLTVVTDTLAKKLRWVNSQNQFVGNTSQITGLAPDVYSLYLTDANGCESFYGYYNVQEAAQLQIVAGSEQISPEQCSNHAGSISNIQVSGGIQPYSYTWTDSNNKQLATTSALSNLAAGIYFLNITDARNCGNVSMSYAINNQSEDLPAPSVSDLQLCSSGNTYLAVNNPVDSATYRLYNSATSSQPLQEQKGGHFTLDILSNQTYYISEVWGTCESSRAALQVTVGLSTLNIANAFSPNGDGINDYWQISGLQNYPTALVQIFNRYGQKLFESKGYGIPFDGTYNGKKLPAGVYYYIINLNSKCNLLSGSLTIFR